ncbi:MAG: hypothetical protein AAFX93_18695 [Verrucomicrobiota bacterium]
MKRRQLSYEENHPYYQRARAHADEHTRPLEWVFWELELWRPYRTYDGAELQPPIDPQSGMPGHVHHSIALPPPPDGWRRRTVGARIVDTPQRKASRKAMAPVVEEPQSELF